MPCRLCWYQRIAMYPLPVLLGIAWWKRDAGIRRYVVPLALIGLLISTYHILVERFPSLEDSGVCEVSNPCTIRWVERFGFVTIPTMAFAAFALISGLLVHPAPGAASPAEPSSPSAAEPSPPPPSRPLLSAHRSPSHEPSAAATPPRPPRPRPRRGGGRGPPRRRRLRDVAQERRGVDLGPRPGPARERHRQPAPGVPRQRERRSGGRPRGPRASRDAASTARR